MSLPDDSRLLGDFLRGEARATGPCPDDNAIAAWAEGRLDEARADAVESHLSTCDACRATATELRSLLGTAESTDADVSTPSAAASSRGAPREAGAPLPSLDAARARRVRKGAWALAAAILVAVGAGIAALARRGEESVDDRLVAAAGDLRSRSPEEFASFTPIGAAERRAFEVDLVRAGLSVRRPAGTVLESRPTIEWAGGGGAESFEVLLAGPDGTEIWRRKAKGHELSFPADAAPLSAGTAYVVEVSPIGGASDGGRVTRGFRVASAADAASWAKAVAAVEKSAPADLRPLLLAHAAARRGLLLEADVRAGEAIARGGRGGDVAAQTRAWIRSRLGWESGEKPGSAGPR